MTSVVEIHGSSAAQLVESAAFSLGEGTLHLIVNADAVTVRLGELAFPLSPDTPVLTHSQNPLWYFFKVPVGASASYVRITLPTQCDVPGTEEHTLRDRFEDTLVQAGLLQTGIEAAGDEIGASVKADAAWISHWIALQAGSYVMSHPPTGEPMTFSSSFHSVAASASSGSATAAGYATSAAQAFAKGAIGVGSNIVNLFGGADSAPKTPDTGTKLQGDLAEAGYTEGVDPEGRPISPHPFDLKPLMAGATSAASTVVETLSPVGRAARSVATGLYQGKNQVKEAVHDGVQTVVTHDLGPEAADLTSKAEETGGNITAIGKSVVDVTPVGVAKKAATGEGFSEEAKP